MVKSDFNNKVINAAKWSSMSEIAAKLVSPITSMILARLLVPEAFGIVATLTMIISFAEMFADSGFQKYLIQHEFKNEKEKFDSSNVAFWTNFGIAMLLWIIIFLFRNQIAELVGNPSLGNVLAIASAQLPLNSFSSIQMSLFRREFDFKTLFLVRIITILIPLIITIPLAFAGTSYWSLIIGNLVMQILNSIILTIKSNWKPKIFYDIKLFKEMFSFSIWSLVEAVTIWLTIWIDTFIIGSFLNQYYLGLYKTSISLVNTIMALITSATIPVLFATLSRLQNNHEEFNEVFFKFQKLVSILIIPLGVGVYLYSELMTKILLGNQWGEASGIIGIWALTSAITIVFSYFNSEVYRAKGRPKLSFFSQLLHLIFLIPVIIVSGTFGFWPLVYSRSIARLQGIIVGFFFMKVFIGIPVSKIVNNVLPAILSSLAMGIFGLFLKGINGSVIWEIISICLCILFYFGFLYLFTSIRKELKWVINKIIPNKIVGKF